jgi:hypothetical protein
MTAQIITFPRPPVARVIPITAAPAERKAPPSITERAFESVRSNFLGALHGEAAYLRALELQGRQRGNPEIARLAGMLVTELERDTVEAPCDVEMGDLA